MTYQTGQKVKINDSLPMFGSTDGRQVRKGQVGTLRNQHSPQYSNWWAVDFGDGVESWGYPEYFLEMCFVPYKPTPDSNLVIGLTHE